MWNMEEKKIQGFEQAVRVLPLRLRQEAMALPEEQRARVEELRLRWGRPMAAVLPEGERPLGGEPVTGQELEQLLELASRASFHTVADQLRRGYLTVEGGHRVGLCGTAVVRDGELRGLRRLSSAAVRVARQAVGAARPVSDRLLRREGTLYSTLILAPPGAGKTTLLRDLIRAASDGEGMTPHRVGVADERGEVAALWNGRPQLEVGARTDVLEGCPKALALMLLLRAMNPQVLAADEITAPEDVRALISAAAELGCIAAGGTEEQRCAVREYARCIGRAFQIQDDILDVTSTDQELGKSVGSDRANEKNTFVTVLGLERSRALVEELTGQAEQALSGFGDPGFLLCLARALAGRRS